MIQLILLFINKILCFGVFKLSEIPKRVYTELLTEFQEVENKGVICIPYLIKKYCRNGGDLIADETVNGKYGLANIVRKLKILNNGGYCFGYKLVLFLWNKDNMRIPIGFGFYHKGSESVTNITLEFISRLRNTYKVKPDSFLADGAYCVHKLMKRLDDYGWAFIIRFKSNGKIDKTPIKKLIVRGYGTASGHITNGVKIKVFKRVERFYACNRMLMCMQEIVQKWKKRWKIEETFRFLKSCIGINRCQQHTVRAQELFIWVCLIAFTCLENLSKTVLNSTIYETFNLVISGDLKLDDNHLKEVLALN